MLTLDALGWLHGGPGDPAVQVVPAHAARMGRSFTEPAPLAPVWHTLDTLTPAALAAEHWQKAPPPGAAASAHVILGRDGVIYQCVPATRIAWHVRGGGMVAGREVASVNSNTFGIELENVGGLRRIMEGQRPAFYGWPYWRKDARGNPREALGPDPLLRLDDYRGARAQLVGGRWCDGFTAEQLATAAELLRGLVHVFPSWRREWCGSGHVDYEPARKEDPWPLFRAQHLPAILDLAFAP